MSKTPKVVAVVIVENFKREIVENATVTLSRVDEKTGWKAQAGDRLIELHFDKSTRSYRGEVPAFGAYLAKVKAEEYAADERVIRVQRRGARERFILGRRGMPFYFEGNVKVPVDPDLAENLLGVAFRPDAPEDALDALEHVLTKTYKMKREKVPEALAHLPFRIYRFHPNTEEHLRSEIVKFVLSNEAVTYAGALIELNSRNYKLLTSDFIAKFHTKITPEDVDAVATKYGMLVVRRILYIANAYLLRSKELLGLNALKAANDLARAGATFYVEPDLVLPIIDAQVVTTDPEFANQWHLNPVAGDANMQIGGTLPSANEQAWNFLRTETTDAGVQPGQSGDITRGSENVVIAIFDFGVKSAEGKSIHPDFDGDVTSGAYKVYKFYDFMSVPPVANNDTIPGIGVNEYPHGIQAAGIAAALANGMGVVGVAANCPIISAIRPSQSSTSLMLDAWSWMGGLPTGNTTLDSDGVRLDPGADIINNSFTWANTLESVEDTFTALATWGRKGRGTIMVFAAGNNNKTISDSIFGNPPATHELAIAVAASRKDDGGRYTNPTAGDVSNYGDEIDVCAPGEAIYTTKETSPPGYGEYTDSSAAAPIVSGIIALMLSINPRLNWQEVRNILRTSAEQIDAGNADPDGHWTGGFSKWYGYGRVNALNAVTQAKAHSGPDLVIRDSLQDTGEVPSTGWTGTPDLWVKNDLVDAPPTVYDELAIHENPIRDQDNYVFVRVKNFGEAPVPVDQYKVRALVCYWPGFSYYYPDDWIPKNVPADPAGDWERGAYLIGEAPIGNLAAHNPLNATDPDTWEIVQIFWDQNLIPPADATVDGMLIAWHPCLLAEVTPHTGPLPSGTPTWYFQDNNLTQKNISIVDVP